MSAVVLSLRYYCFLNVPFKALFLSFSLAHELGFARPTPLLTVLFEELSRQACSHHSSLSQICSVSCCTATRISTLCLLFLWAESTPTCVIFLKHPFIKSECNG